VQEFIQNTIKYADASEITIQIKDEHNKFLLHLSDNGQGFDLKEISYGNGILNMKRRCEDLNGNFEILSGMVGTQVFCEIPF
jgi:signal transduction histidine kinase